MIIGHINLLLLASNILIVELGKKSITKTIPIIKPINQTKVKLKALSIIFLYLGLN